jgi:hypothetical protein
MVDGDEFLKKGMVIQVMYNITNCLIERVNVLYGAEDAKHVCMHMFLFVISWSMDASLILDLSHTER